MHQPAMCDGYFNIGFFEFFGFILYDVEVALGIIRTAVVNDEASERKKVRTQALASVTAYPLKSTWDMTTSVQMLHEARQLGNVYFIQTMLNRQLSCRMADWVGIAFTCHSLSWNIAAPSQ